MTSPAIAANMTCCHALSSLLEGMVSYPASTAYEASLASYFTLQQAGIHPECIVSPNTAHDVSRIMQVVTGDSQAPCAFAVRSGGHSTNPGASNIQEGFTIDLRGLAGIELNPDRSSVTVGSGNTWGSLYSYLDPWSLSVVGGRSYSVGVGGVITGGGISYFSPRYGWACDTVANFEVVLANGSIINVNQQQNTDLLWALRGGTNNFGIITSMELLSFPQEGLWGGTSFHAPSTKDQEIDALSRFSSGPYDEYASLIGTFRYDKTGSSIINSMEYTRVDERPQVFQEFFQIPALNKTFGIANMTSLSSGTEAMQSIGERASYATVTIHPTAEAINTTVRAWNESLAMIQDVTGIAWALVLEPLPPSIYLRHAKENALGLEDRQNKPLMVVLLSVTWSDVGDDNRVTLAMKSLISRIERDVGDLDALDPYLYLNYAAAWQDPIRSYGQSNLAKLAEIRKAYDPGNLFTDYVPGGFKIPRIPEDLGFRM
ncbi:putative FAD-binding domain-containing protein [Rosellinia necatrix]|uniref:Putative FAD-binding domain-containing protein n=1 Tax=Rosellinia necatrix TaxID=77044 RepID=A0A1W2TKX6_ROSNE|nr:putative FAD-binding domain-containing protein [Rosellinia necatrix]